MSNRIRAGVALVTGLLVGTMLVGCGGPNEASDEVCLKFARFTKGGQPTDQRWNVVTSMSGQIDDADQNLRDAYSGLYREIDHDWESWLVVSEEFAKACIDNGWLEKSTQDRLADRADG